MKREELFELVAVLTAKNMALEEEIKRLNKQTHRLWEDLKEYEELQNEYDEEFDFDYDEDPRVLEELKAGYEYDDYSPSSDLDVPDYDENNYPSMEEEAKNVLDEIIKQDYEANCIHEKDVELNQRVAELEKRVRMFDLDYAELKSKVLDLDSWNIAKALHDRVTELEEKEDNYGK